MSASKLTAPEHRTAWRPKIGAPLLVGKIFILTSQLICPDLRVAGSGRVRPRFIRTLLFSFKLSVLA